MALVAQEGQQSLLFHLALQMTPPGFEALPQTQSEAMKMLSEIGH